MGLRQVVLVGLVALKDLNDLRMVRRRRNEIENPEALQSRVRPALVAILEQQRVAVLKKINAPDRGRNHVKMGDIIDWSQRSSVLTFVGIRNRRHHAGKQSDDRQKAEIFSHD